MNDWEQHANLGLQSLGDALQRGHIDREEYRRRRRRLLQGIRERNAQTQPNALRPAGSAGQPRGLSGVATAGAIAGPRLRRHWSFAVVACAIIALGVILWWRAGRGG